MDHEPREEPSDDPELVLTPEDVAGLLRISVADAERLIRDGELRGFEVAGQRRVVAEDLVEFLRRKVEESSLKTLRRSLIDPAWWFRAMPPDVRATIVARDYPEGSLGAWWRRALADESWLRRQLEDVAPMSRTEDAMFPRIFDDEEPWPKSKVYSILAVLTARAGGATAAEVADELLRWGIAVGDRPAVIARVEGLLEEIRRRPADRTVQRSPDGRYRVGGPGSAPGATGPDLGQLQRLEAECERAIRALLQRTLSETDYRPTGFMRMVTERGAVGAVRALLATDRAPEEFHAGLVRLWQLQRLDLSVERFAVHGPCAALFSEEERRRARARLDELGHREPS